MRRFTIGDIHGNFLALQDVLLSANFDNDKDQLIVLGDITDGHIQTSDCIDRVLQIKNLVYVMGNHDIWLKMWLDGDFDNIFDKQMVLDGDIKHYVKDIKWFIKRNDNSDLFYWFNQGGRNTLESYNGKTLDDLKRHKDLFDNSAYYYLQDNMAFVHGGFELGSDLSKVDKTNLVWDRGLFYDTFINFRPMKNPYDKVFIGHSTTQIIRNTVTPLIRNKIYDIDTGAGYNGKLSMMNIDTDKIYQSLLANAYYTLYKIR